MGIKYSALGPMQGSIWRDVIRGKCYVMGFNGEGKFGYIADCADDVRQSVRDSTVIDASNVQDQMSYVNGVFDIGHLPIILPPFHEMWVESSASTDNETHFQKATLWNTWREDDEWKCHVAAFVKHGPGETPWFLGRYFLTLDESGAFVSGKPAYNVVQDDAPPIDLIQGTEDERGCTRAIIRCLVPHAFAVSLMHCKNIELNERTVDETPKRRERDARSGIPKLTFKTLSIGFTPSARRSGSGASSRVDRSLHICRGHFSEYTEEKPLFGKYSGRFWIPQHARGSKAAGIVQKDYKVVPPKAGEAA